MGVSTALMGWRGYAAAFAVGAVIAGGGAWKAQSWRYGAEIAEMKADQAARVADSQRQAREILERRVAEVGQINEQNAKAEWAAYGGMRNAQIQDDALRADVDAGRQRLHVAASCPAARSDYFALRAGIQQLTAQLAACQAWQR